MRKIFLFFAFIGITLGLIFGVRSELMKNSDAIESGDIISGDNYIHELNLPIMEIDSLNPILTYNEQVSNLLGLIYESLVCIGTDDSINSCLAVEWAEKDDTSWIIKLRNGVKWHDGNKFTADDVVFTINQLLSGDLASPYSDNVNNVVSAEAIDEHSVLINLAQSDEFFIYKLLFPIIPEHYFKNGGMLNNDKNNMPVGTGAFKYASNDETVLRLDRNKTWWNLSQNSRLNTIYLYKYTTYGEAIKAYKSSEVDLIVTTMSDWEKKFGTIGNNDYGFESSIFDTIIPNTNKTALSDSSVRKAILYAINRENIVSQVFEANATIVDLPIHTKSKNYLSNVQSNYDLDMAKQVLINAGWQWNNGVWSKNISGNTYKLSFTMIVNKENDEQLRAAEVVKEGLAELSVSLTIKEVGWDEYNKLVVGDNFELAMASFDIKNELTILDILEENGSMNYSNYTSDKMEAAIKKVRNNYNTESMKEVMEIYKADTPYIGLYFRNNTILTNKSVKGSIEPSWYNPYENIITWCK